jgi:hypothetical protein
LDRIALITADRFRFVKTSVIFSSGLKNHFLIVSALRDAPAEGGEEWVEEIVAKFSFDAAGFLCSARLWAKESTRRASSVWNVSKVAGIWFQEVVDCFSERVGMPKGRNFLGRSKGKVVRMVVDENQRLVASSPARVEIKTIFAIGSRVFGELWAGSYRLVASSPTILSIR